MRALGARGGSEPAARARRRRGSASAHACQSRLGAAAMGRASADSAESSGQGRPGNRRTATGNTHCVPQLSPPKTSAGGAATSSAGAHVADSMRAVSVAWRERGPSLPPPSLPPPPATIKSTAVTPTPIAAAPLPLLSAPTAGTPFSSTHLRLRRPSHPLTKPTLCPRGRSSRVSRRRSVSPLGGARSYRACFSSSPLVCTQAASLCRLRWSPHSSGWPSKATGR